jgi:hypothetical protein
MKNGYAPPSRERFACERLIGVAVLCQLNFGRRLEQNL